MFLWTYKNQFLKRRPSFLLNFQIFILLVFSKDKKLKMHLWTLLHELEQYQFLFKMVLSELRASLLPPWGSYVFLEIFSMLIFVALLTYCWRILSGHCSASYSSLILFSKWNTVWVGLLAKQKSTNFGFLFDASSSRETFQKTCCTVEHWRRCLFRDGKCVWTTGQLTFRKNVSRWWQEIKVSSNLLT